MMTLWGEQKRYSWKTVGVFISRNFRYMQLERVDSSGAKQMAGVLVVQEGDLIAVLHEHPDTAWETLVKIWAEFEPSKSALDDDNIFDHLLGAAPPGSVVKEGGKLETGRSLAAELFENTYMNPNFASIVLMKS
jgi:hypothetical protein